MLFCCDGEQDFFVSQPAVDHQSLKASQRTLMPLLSERRNPAAKIRVVDCNQEGLTVSEGEVSKFHGMTMVFEESQNLP